MQHVYQLNLIYHFDPVVHFRNVEVFITFCNFEHLLIQLDSIIIIHIYLSSFT